MKILQNVQEEEEFERSYNLLRTKEVRWNSFYYATNRVRLLFSPILMALKKLISQADTKHEEADVDEIYKSITDFKFVYMMNWPSDFLGPVCELNKNLQAANYELAKFKENIDLTINIVRADYVAFEKPNLNDSNNMNQEYSNDLVLKHHLSFGGLHLSLFLSKCVFQTDGKVRYNFKEDESVYLIYSKLRAIELKFLIPKAAKFFELNSILPEEGSFYKNFQIFIFADFEKRNQKLNNYGNREITQLAAFYLSDRPEYRNQTDIVVFEWNKVKTKVSQSLRTSEINKKDIITFVLTDKFFEDGYKGIREIFEIYSTIPCSNAEVERGFPALNRIKTRERNRLSSDKLLLAL